MGMSGHAPGGAVVGVTIGMTILAGLSVAMRLMTRIRIVRNAGADDFLIVIALLFSIATTVTMCMQVKYGLGRHQNTLSAQDQLYILKPFWASVWLYYAAGSFTKFSILVQYLRIVSVGNKFRKACYIMLGLVTIWSAWTILSAIFACTPIEHFWDANVPGKCLNRFAVWFFNAGSNIVTDCALAVLPIPIFKSLELPPRQKYALIAVFALGGVTCVVSILRLQSIYVISQATDISWNNPLAAIWSSVEANTGILCSCIPTLKGCVSKFFPQLFGRSRRLYGSATRNGRKPTEQQSDGRRLSGTGVAGFTQKTLVQSRVDAMDSQEDIEMERTDGKSGWDDGGIHVTTVVRQEEHTRRDVESESVKGLMAGSVFHPS